jgi:hypothetical protein
MKHLKLTKHEVSLLTPEQISLSLYIGAGEIFVRDGNDAIATKKECTSIDSSLVDSVLFLLKQNIGGNEYKIIVCQKNELFILDIATFLET